MPSSIVAILNEANNFTQRINLSSPIEEDFVRFMSNVDVLIKVSFLQNGYLYDATTKVTTSDQGLAIAGSHLAYQVKEKPWSNATIELLDKTNLIDNEIQIVMYFFS